MKNIIEVRNLRKYYPMGESEVKAVDDITFNVEEGEFLGIMGPSGSGKSTLLNMISTITSITDGKITFDGEKVEEMGIGKLTKFRRKNLGFVFQDFNLLDTLNLYDNIALALTLNKWKGDKIKEAIEKTAGLVGIDEILNKFPHEVSGGQAQRCAIARAIITSPRLLLADEPTGALDSTNAANLMEHLTKMNRKNGLNILLVTHDVFSASYCRRILFLKDGKIFKEINREDKSRGEFLDEILKVVALMGGGRGVVS